MERNTRDSGHIYWHNVSSTLTEDHRDDNNNMSHRRHSLRTRSRRNQDGGPASQMKVKKHPDKDMTKPLKTWLYEHRDHPYPSKTEKVLLALGSQMTLTQVSNWFANARRRLKTTVRQSGLTWSRRIQLYDRLSSDIEDRLSVCSEEETIENPLPDTRQIKESGLHSDFGAVACRLPPSPVKEGTFMEGCRFPVHKYKHTILQRYLNDAMQHATRQSLFSGHVTNREQDRSSLGRSKVNSFSGSTSSHDLERMSPVPSEADTVKLDGEVSSESESLDRPDTTHWLEIDAALALTNFVRARNGQALCL